MGLKTFNIDDELYERFGKVHRGDMSKIVSELIKNYLDSAQEDIEVEKLDKKLKLIESEISELKKKKSNLTLLISQAKEHILQKEKEEKEVSESVRQWAKDVIKDAKASGSYTDLVYESEKADFGSEVELYLIDKWEKQQNEHN